MNLKKVIASIFLSLIFLIPASAATRVGGENAERAPLKSFFDLASDQLLTNAKKYIGRPYRIGSTGPRSFDCSGFTSFVFKTLDITLNRTSRAQYTQGKSVKKESVRVGDLVFFRSAHSGGGVGHVGIVSSVESDGSFKFIHSSCHKGVTISTINDPYWSKRYKGARRIMDFY